MVVETFSPLFIGGLGAFEIALIFLVVVILFGASKIPELARSSGQAIGEFQKGKEEVEQELKEIREGDADIEDVDGDIEDVDADVESDGEKDSTAPN